MSYRNSDNEPAPTEKEWAKKWKEIWSERMICFTLGLTIAGPFFYFYYAARLASCGSP